MFLLSSGFIESLGSLDGAEGSKIPPTSFSRKKSGEFLLIKRNRQPPFRKGGFPSPQDGLEKALDYQSSFVDSPSG
jgi:hypothetical protein